jgi:hypothetical protein
MENKNVKEELEKAIKANDTASIEAIIKDNPSLVNMLPEGEYSAEITMIGDYVKMLNDFSAGFKTVGALPDDFFLNDALVAELKSAAKKRFTTQFGSRMSEEELEDNVNMMNESIEGRANKVKAIKELSESKKAKNGEGFGSDFGAYPEY